MHQRTTPARLTRRQAIVATLGSDGWFGQLPDELREAILDASHESEHVRGELIVQQGQDSQGLYAVLDGHVAVTRWVAEDREVMLHVGEPGLWFGDLALLAEVPAAVAVSAHTDVRLLRLATASYRRLVDERPERFRAFAQLAFRHYSLFVRALADNQALQPIERLRSRLKHIVELERKDRDGAKRVEIHATQAELAQMIGVSRQTLNALIHRLEQDGVLEVGFKSLTVPDVGRLRD